MQITLLNEIDSLAFAECLAEFCKPPLIIYLQGEIGAGKTTLIRALLRKLGVQGPIKSPTFSLIEPYQIKHWHFYHVDLYRLSSPEELEYTGLSDCLTQETICCIEWPERANDYLPAPDLNCRMIIKAQGRVLELTSSTIKGEMLVLQLEKLYKAE